MLHPIIAEILSDQKYSDTRTSLWVACWFTGISAMVLDYYYLDPTYWLGSILFTAAAIIGMISEIRVNLIYRYFAASSGYYLNGYTVRQILDSDLFGRLSHYLRHGLCYEAAMLNMLMFGDNRTSRLVFARATTDEGARVWHSWVEFRAYRLWWCVDPTWCDRQIVLRQIHNYQYDVKYHRIISWGDFWSYRVAHDMRERLSDRRTSYLFYELSLFRKISSDVDDAIFIDELGHDFKIPNDGKTPNPNIMDMFHPDTPVSQRIINEYMADCFRIAPKRRSVRTAKRCSRLVAKAHPE